MLKRIEAYIKDEKLVSQKQLALYFEMNPTALEPLLDFLIKRKTIRAVDAKDCGQKCNDCESMIYYEWQG
jgi:hypothetical protein